MASPITIASLYSKKQVPCKGRKTAKCNAAKKKCRWVDGPKLKYCRRRKSAKRGKASKSKSMF